MSTASPGLEDYILYYTGGGSNSTPSASIGDAVSTARVLNQSASALTLVTGVVIDDATGNTPGIGTLAFTLSGKFLTWTPYAGSAGTPVAVGASGKFFIQGGGTGAGGLCVTVTDANLPSGNVSDSVTIANQTQKMFENLTKAETLAGVTKYRCFAVMNEHASMPMTSCLEWIAANTPGQDNITIGLDPLPAGGGGGGYGGTAPNPLADEFTAPSGVTFVNPTSISDPNVLAIGTLDSHECRFIWFKLVCPSNVTAASPINTFNRGYSITA